MPHMPNWMTRSLKFIRDLPSRASPRWPWPLRKVRKANIPQEDRDYFERYGETVIAMQVSGSFKSDEERARAWLTERADYHERRDAWISGRDFALEIVVIALILSEIILQSRDFEKQQTVLTNLQDSSAATASAMTSLQHATEAMSTTLQMQLDAVRKSEAQAERSAKAGETSASTASRALHVSERAYVHMTPSLAKPPSAGEKLQYSVLIGNSGRTPALEMTAHIAGTMAPSSIPTDQVRATILKEAPPLHDQSESVGTLPAGQTATEHTDAPTALTQSDVDQITAGKILLYIFGTASYKDIFQQPHHTEICAFYEPASKTFGACHELNKSD